MTTPSVTRFAFSLQTLALLARADQLAEETRLLMQECAELGRSLDTLVCACRERREKRQREG